MGSATNRSSKDDLLSLDSSPLRTDEPARATPPTYQLPSNLPNALSHLDDGQLERLLSAVTGEFERRGKKVPIRQRIERKPPAEDGAAPLAFGKLNAIRAAFKAGVKPSHIAKQFGVSQADVHRAVKNDDRMR
jgi:hypothetical protein